MKNLNSLANLKFASSKKKDCIYCDKKFSLANFNKHTNSCRLNPKNMRECPVCKKLHSKNGTTCSYSCSNTYFRSGINNPNWKNDNYQTTCWHYHKKECIICGENKIVAVHHYDHNHNNNDPSNLIPMCPTHHQYIHSRYADEIKHLVDDYVVKFKLGFA